MSIEIDMSEVTKLADDFGSMSKLAIPVVGKVLAKGALNIKNQMRDEAKASGIPEAAKLAGFISYDRAVNKVAEIAYEIGPREGASGSFGFLYYGNRKNGPVLPDPMLALQKEGDNIEKFVTKALGDLL